MGEVIIYTREELGRTIQHLEDHLEALVSNQDKISDVGDSNNLGLEIEHLQRGIQRLKDRQDELSTIVYRWPSIVNIKSKSFSGSDAAGSYQLGLEDGFKLLKDYLKKIKPDGNWDEVCGNNAKQMLNK